MCAPKVKVRGVDIGNGGGTRKGGVEREGGREREREKFIDNQIGD